MPSPLAIIVAASAARTTSGASAALDLLDLVAFPDQLPRGVATLLLDVTAASGTNARLDVVIETSPSGSSWEPVLAFDQVAATSYHRMKFGTLERYVRARWTVAGTTPSFTFAITGSAEIIYATHDDFYGLGLPKSAVGITEPPDLLTSCLLAASSYASGKLSCVATLPIAAPYPESLKLAVCEVAAWKFLAQRGFDPDDPADKEVKLRHDAAVTWLYGLCTGDTELEPVVPNAATSTYAEVYSDEPREW